MSRSLLGRLVVRLLVVTTLFVIFGSAALIYHFTDHVNTLHDQNLTGQARDIARHLTVDRSGTIRLALPEPLRRDYAASNGMSLFAIMDGEGSVLISSGGVDRPLADLPDPDDGPAPDSFQIWRKLAGKSMVFYGITLPVRVGSRDVFIQVAQGPNHTDVLIDEFLEELWPDIIWVALLVFLAILAVVYATVRSSLRPVREISDQAAAISAADTDQRLEVEGLPRELVPLVRAVNDAFRRMSDAYSRQKEFTGNAAHEMRTPLAVLRAHIESLGDRQLTAALLPDVVRLERLFEQMLRLAQADSFVAKPGERADLCDVAIDVASLLSPEAISQGKLIELDAPQTPVRVVGNASFLSVALRNLVENALNVTQPHRGARVAIRVAEPGILEVGDQGPGIPAEQREKIFERFWRADPSKENGSGLGLPIVKQIVEAHDGRIVVSDNEGGGALFTLFLPSAPDRIDDAPDVEPYRKSGVSRAG